MDSNRRLISRNDAHEALGISRRTFMRLLDELPGHLVWLTWTGYGWSMNMKNFERIKKFYMAHIDRYKK